MLYRLGLLTVFMASFALATPMTYSGAGRETCVESVSCSLGGQELAGVAQDALLPSLPSPEAKPTTLDRIEDFLFSCLERGGCLVHVIFDPIDKSAPLGLLEPH